MAAGHTAKGIRVTWRAAAHSRPAAPSQPRPLLFHWHAKRPMRRYPKYPNTGRPKRLRPLPVSLLVISCTCLPTFKARGTGLPLFGSAPEGALSPSQRLRGQQSNNEKCWIILLFRLNFLARTDFAWKMGRLCHGISGNGYALLTIFRATKDKKWLHRAR